MPVLFQWLSRFPLPWMQRLGALGGWCVWCVSGAYRRQFESQYAAAGLTWQQAKPAVAAAGMVLTELPYLWMRPSQQNLALTLHWRGADHIQAAIDSGRGLVVLSPHLGCWELGAQALAERFGAQFSSLWVMFRPSRKAWLSNMVANSRNRPFLTAVPANASGVRALLRALRGGACTAILPDQVPPMGQGVWSRFFERDAYTMTLGVKLARQTGAAVVWGWCERLSPGLGFVIHIGAWDDPRLYDAQVPIEDMVLAMNQHIETMVLASPGQYLWGYARDKQPRGES